MQNIEEIISHLVVASNPNFVRTLHVLTNLFFMHTVVKLILDNVMAGHNNFI